MTFPLEYLAMIEDACLLVCKWAMQKIVDAFLARIYTMCNLCSTVSFGHCAPQKYAVILHSLLFVVVALSVFA